MNTVLKLVLSVIARQLELYANENY